MMEGMALGLEIRAQSLWESESMSDGVGVAKQAGKSRGIALGGLAFRPKATGQ